MLKKEWDESQKERKIKEIELFLVSPRRKRHQKKGKKGEKCQWNDFKSYENYYFNAA